MESNEDQLFQNLGVEIDILREENFLKIKETLTRIGIPSIKNKTIYQTCHILHKRGRYSIFHFKELFVLDRLDNTIVEDDILRRNTIVDLLEEWGLCKVVNENEMDDGIQDLPDTKLKILSYSVKGDWNLEPKYTIGNG